MKMAVRVVSSTGSMGGCCWLVAGCWLHGNRTVCQTVRHSPSDRLELSVKNKKYLSTPFYLINKK